MSVATSVLALALALTLVLAEARLCPNQKDQCPAGMTCCLMVDGRSYGCCPYAGGMCCQDHIHCCPAGTKCNTDSQTCDGVWRNATRLDWMVPLYGGASEADEARREESAPHAGTTRPEDNNRVSHGTDCPDGNTCPSRSTCCQMPQRNYGCCPYPKANCCSDGEHCCPTDYNCDVKDNRCVLKPHLAFTQFLYESNAKVKPIFSLKENTFLVPRAPACPPGNLCALSGYVCCPTGEDSAYCCPAGNDCGVPGRACLKDDRTRAPPRSLLDSLNLFSSSPFPSAERNSLRAASRSHEKTPPKNVVSFFF